MISTEKPGTPEELVHYGVKGMKWGVIRKRDRALFDKAAQVRANKRTPEDQARHDKRVANAKKAAIAAGVLVAVAGAAFVAYKLHQDGKLPVSMIKRSSKSSTAVKQTFDPPTQIIYSSRGKTKGYQFFQRGGITDPEGYMIDRRITEMDNGTVIKLDDGSVAARILDPLRRRDGANRPIGHDIVIPSSMSEGIETAEDVERKIWPLIKDLYKDE